MRIHRGRAIAIREARRFIAIATVRAGRRTVESIRTPPRFRPLSESETEARLGGELLAPLSDARPRA